MPLQLLLSEQISHLARLPLFSLVLFSQNVVYATSFAPKQENTRAVWEASVHVNFLCGGCDARKTNQFTPHKPLFLAFSSSQYYCTQTISTRAECGEGRGFSAASGDLADFLQTEKRDAGRGKQSPLSLFSHDDCKRQNSGELQQVEKIQRSREEKAT